MRRSTRPEPISAPSSKTSITEAGCIQRSATNPRSSSKPNSANSKPLKGHNQERCFAGGFADAFDLADSGQAGPLMVFVQPRDVGRDRRRAGFDAAMIGLDDRLGGDRFAG